MDGSVDDTNVFVGCRYQGAREADREGRPGEGATLRPPCAESPALHQPSPQSQCPAQGRVGILHRQRRQQRVPAQLPGAGTKKTCIFLFMFRCQTWNSNRLTKQMKVEFLERPGSYFKHQLLLNLVPFHTFTGIAHTKY